jgi:hypothetical protein
METAAPSLAELGIDLGAAPVDWTPLNLALPD